MLSSYRLFLRLVFFSDMSVLLSFPMLSTLFILPFDQLSLQATADPFSSYHFPAVSSLPYSVLLSQYHYHPTSPPIFSFTCFVSIHFIRMSLPLDRVCRNGLVHIHSFTSLHFIVCFFITT